MGEISNSFEKRNPSKKLGKNTLLVQEIVFTCINLQIPKKKKVTKIFQAFSAEFQWGQKWHTRRETPLHHSSLVAVWYVWSLYF